MTASRSAFEAELGIELDRFQIRAFDALDAGSSVLVAAPTGAGKTLVAEYAIHRALAEGGKVFYTTPLKALSNQKYGDFVRVHGSRRVGLLTGDNAVNGDAPIVVMTTEVLRNMIYAGAPTLGDLRYVVLDEVHYLQNRYRGAVWEEVIIHLAPEVDLVCLSATVSNAEEFADWIATVRGHTAAIIEERRPVELTNLYAVADRASGDITMMPTFVRAPGGELGPNPEAARPRRPGSRARRARPSSARVSPHRAARSSSALLREQAMLPVITFIFSRAACDDAVQQCLAAGLRLTDAGERRRAAGDRRRAQRARSPTTTSTRSATDDWLSGLRERHRRAPCRTGPSAQGSGGGGVRRGPGEGRVRDRDALARHQHAGTLGRDREALEVHRRAPRVPHAGGVHTAHRARRAPRHRRRRLRGRLLEPVRPVRPGGGPRVRAGRRR